MEIKKEYQISEAIKSYLESSETSLDVLAMALGVSTMSLANVVKTNSASKDILEKFYSYLYKTGYKINPVKEEFLKETKKDKILFHGSKFGLKSISTSGSRGNCDFGNGLYLGETYSQALSFVCEIDNSSVYSFSFHNNKLNILSFDCSIEWMLAICFYRGFLKNYIKSPKIIDIISRIQKADLIIAPIADNRMFFIMSSFANGDINSNVAIHSLSASSLGLQYIFKTEKALECLTPIEKYYLCSEEKRDSEVELNKRSNEIDTKLKMAKREFRNGPFIEEIL